MPLDVLHAVARRPIPRKPTVQEAMLAIAALGGSPAEQRRTLSVKIFRPGELPAPFIIFENYELSHHCLA
jgi:hypothetical protein